MKTLLIAFCLSLLVDLTILANLSQIEFYDTNMDSETNSRPTYEEYVQQQSSEKEEISQATSDTSADKEETSQATSGASSNTETNQSNNHTTYPKSPSPTYSYYNPWNTANDDWHTNGNRNVVVDILYRMSSSEYRQRAIPVNARDVLNHVSHYYGEVLQISGEVYNTDWYAANTETFFPNRSACQEINIVSDDGTAVALYIENGDIDVRVGDRVNLYGMVLGTQAQTSRGPAIILMGKPIIDKLSTVQSYPTYHYDTYYDNSYDYDTDYDDSYSYDTYSNYDWNTTNDDWHTNGNRYGVIEMLSQMSNSEYRQRAISVNTNNVLNHVSDYYGDVLQISGRVYNTDRYAANTETFFPNKSACQEINIVSDNGTAVALYIENGNIDVEVGEYVTLYGMAIGTQAQTSKGPAIILMGKPVIDR